MSCYRAGSLQRTHRTDARRVIRDTSTLPLSRVGGRRKGATVGIAARTGWTKQGERRHTKGEQQRAKGQDTNGTANERASAESGRQNELDGGPTQRMDRAR